MDNTKNLHGMKNHKDGKRFMEEVYMLILKIDIFSSETSLLVKNMELV